MRTRRHGGAGADDHAEGRGLINATNRPAGGIVTGRKGKMKLYVKRIEYQYENQPARRRLKLTLNNGRVIRAEACHESWEQWGGTTEELCATVPTVERHNEWLHGGERP